MSRDDILEVLLEDLDIEQDNVDESSTLESMEFDSMTILGVISILDYTCGVVVSSQAIANCKTMGDIIDLAVA